MIWNIFVSLNVEFVSEHTNISIFVYCMFLSVHRYVSINDESDWWSLLNLPTVCLVSVEILTVYVQL